MKRVATVTEMRADIPNNRLRADPQMRRGFGRIYRNHLAAFAVG
jgi:hypothetical protein